jgi:hypothetical protein
MINEDLQRDARVLALHAPASWQDACKGHSWNEQEQECRVSL